MANALTDTITLLRPSALHFGEGALANLPGWVAERGYAKPFVIADPVNANRLERLGLGEVGCFGTVQPEPDRNNLMAAVAAAKGADVIIGFGGGSAMDLAKLVAVMAGTDLQLSEISGPNRAPARKVGLVQVPTTAGTGSEVGTRALVTDPDTLAKVATESTHMLADIAIIDPMLTLSVPPMVTAATGVDAMAHCVEAFTSKRAHPIIDAYALQGIELVGKHLKTAVTDGDNVAARAGLSLAAFYGGVCLGPVNTTAGHALSYPLGTRHKMAHGIANALIFPHVLAANSAAAPEKTAQICAALGFEFGDEDAVRARATAFCSDLGLDMRLRAHGVPEDDLATMAQEAHGIRRLLDWNPRDLSVTEIEAIYLAAY
ncbi:MULTISPECIES: iron-containing alcohol dehydrogenase [unclassified Thioclava]|uniref:iron-containing alcohol dehydrogenase n=1 Tax=unclassified Thioclava TaxID=2621713 RepID=UPI000998496C|nr:MULTISPECIES: iron-containing alcohol dehydrogenase [unclassified Thioclava]OOY02976.1 alcohol dehydrogenase [Thioclava sp. F28-4]OWY08888.1 alcohol dehydrogenase [Thioclava sp. F34-6]